MIEPSFGEVPCPLCGRRYMVPHYHQLPLTDRDKIYAAVGYAPK